MGRHVILTHGRSQVPIPDYQTLMLPLLESLVDGPRRRRDLVDSLAATFKLTEEERQQRIPSGRHGLLYDRLHWAIKYLAESGLVNRPSRYEVALTSEGRKVLSARPGHIDLAFLSRYESFRKFHTRKRNGTVKKNGRVTVCGPGVDATEMGTPEERIEQAYGEIRSEAVAQILDRLKIARPHVLERVVIDLLVAMGYGKGEVTGKSGDRGIDGFVLADPLGFNTVLSQAKRYNSRYVSHGDIRLFMGSMEHHGATRGVFVTTGDFRKDAREAAERAKRGIVTLINGETLAGLLFDYGIGVVPVGEPRQIKRLDEGWIPDEELDPALASGDAIAG